MKNRPFSTRLGFALAGIRACWRTERSFRTHCFCATFAATALFTIQPAPVWWALTGLAVALVLALELINSAIERLIDHLHPDIHPEIGHVKDMAAGAVLTISLGALVIAASLAVTMA
ncbi:diacylglycerol kinase [Sphingomonas oryzagri]|uniref:Diacylglycerol kinase n=1 Tax=Sphingomonas oryzagri TaxID=3042314 RepID=A0ABT6MWI9_9SPHN|nr:diacylglycerol kinase [Sphingomonas oryzagri]MDH7637172.1 diacylglycerol kinase [Sphingomonas oryzagri]